MGFFEFCTPIVALLIGIFILTQMIIPELLGRPYFPLFHRYWKLRKVLEQEHEKVDESTLEEEIEKTKKQYQKEKPTWRQ